MTRFFTTQYLCELQSAKKLLLPPKNEIINVILFCEKITKCVYIIFIQNTHIVYAFRMLEDNFKIRLIVL